MFIGFSNDLVAGVFVGFDNPRPLGYKETGSSVAAPIFKNFMYEVLKNQADLPFDYQPHKTQLLKEQPKGNEYWLNPDNNGMALFLHRVKSCAAIIQKYLPYSLR